MKKYLKVYIVTVASSKANAAGFTSFKRKKITAKDVQEAIEKYKKLFSIENNEFILSVENEMNLDEYEF